MTGQNQVVSKANDFRNVPENALDFNMQVIDPAWQNCTPSILQGKDFQVDRDYVLINGKAFINVDKIITNLDFYTRDIRLSNYDAKDLAEVRWWLEYAGKMADHKYFRAFNYCLMQSARISETSQGKSGFLRKILQTLTTENISKTFDGNKKDFWTGKTPGA